MGRVFGWLLASTGSVVLALGAFVAWMAWDSVSWGFDAFSLQAAVAAGLGAVSLVVGLLLLRGRPLAPVVVGVLVGSGAMILAIDLFLRDFDASLLGDADGWRLGDGGGRSSLAPAWALLVEGALAIAAAVWCRTSLPDPGRSASPTSFVSG